MKKYLLNIITISILLLCTLYGNAQTFKVDTLLYNGSTSNHIDIVLMGDGYKSTEMAKFRADAQLNVNYFLSQAPFNLYNKFFNFFAIEVISVDSGNDHPGNAADEASYTGHSIGPIMSVNNYLQTKFDYAGSYHRLVASANTTLINSIATTNVPQYDYISVLVNSPYYGGSGGSILYSTMDSSATEVFVHEFGHTFGGLQDEYDYGYPASSCGAGTTQMVNVSQRKDSNVVWKNWLKRPLTTYPTPPLTNCNDIGIYTGAQYCATNWYRPKCYCKMRVLGYPFCEVCAEQLIFKLSQKINYINTFTPANLTQSICKNVVLPFNVTLVNTTNNTVRAQWFVDNVLVSNNSLNYSFNSANYSTGSHTVKVVAYDTTLLARKTLTSYQKQWTVTVKAIPTVTVNSRTICAGSTAALSASGATSYTWTGGLPNSANVTTPVLNATTTYTVTGTTSGCTKTAVSTVTVNARPTVTVNSPSICNGSTASLSASGATTYTWTGSLPSGANVTTPVLTATRTYTVTGTANGCTNTAVSTVTVNAKPTVTVNSRTICAGTTAALSASGASTYTWTGGLPSGANVTTPVLNATTTYTVTGTATNGCTNTAVSTVTVNAKPTVTVNSPTICDGSTAALSAGGASSYTWTGGLPNGANVTTPVLNATTTFTVTGTATNGCTNTAVSTVTVNAKPTVTVNSPTICDGSTAALSAGGASTYTWTGGLPNSANITTPVLNATTTYTVTGTATNGCTNTAVSTVTVNAKPTVIVNSPTICEGSIAALSAGGASAYTWTDGLPDGADVTTPVLNTTTNYTVTGTASNGCTNTAVSTVNVNVKPTVTVNSPTICEGSIAALSAGGASTYTWTDGLPDGADVTTPVLDATTTYTVTGNDGNCINTAVSTVTVIPIPMITINSNSPVITGDTIKLSSDGGTTYNWTGPNGFISDLQNPIKENVVLDDSGYYVVTVMNEACTATDSLFVIVYTPEMQYRILPPTPDSDMNVYLKNMLVYPNPTNNGIWVKTQQDISNSKPIEIHVYDLKGTEIYNTTLKDNLQNINFNNYPTGMYLLKINEQTFKIVKK